MLTADYEDLMHHGDKLLEKLHQAGRVRRALRTSEGFIKVYTDERPYWYRNGVRFIEGPSSHGYVRCEDGEFFQNLAEAKEVT